MNAAKKIGTAELTEEKEFLKSYDPDSYEHPSVTNDVLIITTEEKKQDNSRSLPGCGLKILLIRRREHPFKGKWALPGGFVRMEESLMDGAYRRLKEETGIGEVYLEQLYTYGKPDRDPRTRVISVANLALLPRGSADSRPEQAGEEESAWFWVEKRLISGYGGDSADDGKTGTSKREILTLQSEEADILIRYEIVTETEKSALRKKVTRYELCSDSTEALAFDHAEMIEYALERLRNKVEYTPIAFHLLPELFTVKELRDVYEAILGREVLNFRRKIGDMIEETEEVMEGRPFRPAKLFRYNVNWEHEF